MKTLCTPPAIFRALERRRKLIRLARRAFLLWDAAVQSLCEARCDLHPSSILIAGAARRVQHLARRYTALESLLASEARVSTSEVLYTFTHWTGDCPALTADLTTAPKPTDPVPAAPAAPLLAFVLPTEKAVAYFAAKNATEDRETIARRQRQAHLCA